LNKSLVSQGISKIRVNVESKSIKKLKEKIYFGLNKNNSNNSAENIIKEPKKIS
jgi:hypothetical protein